MPQNRHKTGFRGPSTDVGKGTQFKRGQSGNPGGRPRWQPYADAYRKFAALPITALQVTEKDTAAEATVKSILRQAIKEGSVRAAREAADRTEGRVPLPLVGSDDKPIAINVISHIPRPDRSKKPETKRE